MKAIFKYITLYKMCFFSVYKLNSNPLVQQNKTHFVHFQNTKNLSGLLGLTRKYDVTFKTSEIPITMDIWAAIIRISSHSKEHEI